MIIDYFDNSYYKHIDSATKRTTFNFLYRNFVKLFGNIIIPISFLWGRKKYVLKEKNNRRNKIVVSLTTFPARIKTVHYVIESILRQTVTPDIIILYLAKNQIREEELPIKLQLLRKRGVEIKYVDEDLRPHKKYYYAFRDYPEDIIITVDDDIFYPSNLIENLLDLSKGHPGYICCNRACFYSFEKGKLTPYSEWPIGNDSPFNVVGYNILPTGMGGVLYPPCSVSNNIFDIDTIKDNCINADDLWLNLMSRMNNTKVILGKARFGFIPILSTLTSALSIGNAITGNANDIQISNLIRKFGYENYTKNLNECNNLEIEYY